MRTIGLIGGMSWESTAVYYRLLNERVRDRLGGLHSAKVLMASVDFAPIAKMQAAEDWASALEVLVDAAKNLERGGADFIVLCTNTMHIVAPGLAERVSLPLLHIADPTGEAIRAQGLGRVGLLGTRFTMEKAFYRERLEQKFGLEVVVPEAADRELVHRVIYEELCLGVVREESRRAYQGVVERLVEQGAQAVILGCTEIGLLLRSQDVAVPLFDTTLLHAEGAVARACQ